MKEAMRYVLGQGKPKIITFINTKTFFPDNAGIKQDDVCTITSSTLEYGMEILDPNYTRNGFGLRKLKKRKTSTRKLKKRTHRRSRSRARSNKNIKNKSLKKKKRTFKRSNKKIHKI